MAQLALDPADRRIEVEECLAMDFGGAKAELDDGIIFMMAGGTEAHARIAGNIMMPGVEQIAVVDPQDGRSGQCGGPAPKDGSTTSSRRAAASRFRRST